MSTGSKQNRQSANQAPASTSATSTITLVKSKRRDKETKARIVEALLEASAKKLTLEAFALATFGIEIKGATDPKASLVKSAITGAWNGMVAEVAKTDPISADELGKAPALPSVFGGSSGGASADLAPDRVDTLLGKMQAAKKRAEVANPLAK